MRKRDSSTIGVDDGCSKAKKTCDWMARFPDSVKLVHMNLPGTHDSSTCASIDGIFMVFIENLAGNYSDATQASLIRYTGP